MLENMIPRRRGERITCHTTERKLWKVDEVWVLDDLHKGKVVRRRNVKPVFDSVV
jgi:hypothetical protein